MRTALLFFNRDKAENRRFALRTQAILRRHGVKVVQEGSRPDADFGVAIGGDGTMLRAARVCAPNDIPLAGINTGGLGFLSGTEAAEAEKDVVRIAEGAFPIQDRRMLSVECWRDGRKRFGPFLALNDCVVRPREARAFFLRTSLGGRFLTEYFGDGVIVSTPTGSTAYALAAMGPIVEPSLDVLLLTPICPHTLTQRPLILPFDRPLEMTLRQRGGVAGAVVSLDGQVNRFMVEGDRLVIKRYEKPFRLMVNPRRDYFEVLRTKLHWGAEARGRGGRGGRGPW